MRTVVARGVRLYPAAVKVLRALDGQNRPWHVLRDRFGAVTGTMDFLLTLGLIQRRGDLWGLTPAGLAALEPETT